MAACCVAVRFVASGQIGYLSLGDRDGLSIPVRIDAPIVSRSSSQKIVYYRKIAIGMPVVVAPRKPAEYAFIENLSRQSRNQTGKFGHIESSAVRVILDDPPIHIHPDIPAARGCKPNEPCGFTPFRLTHDSILGALPPVNFAHKLSRVSS